MDKSVPNMVLLRRNKMKTKRQKRDSKILALLKTIPEGKALKFLENENPLVAGELIDISEIPPIKRERRKQK